MWPFSNIQFTASSQPSNKSWTFEELEVAPKIALKIDGQEVTPDQVKERQGTAFQLSVNAHTIAFTPAPNGAVQLKVNNSITETISEPLHLNLSPQAVCIGDMCIMWPKKPTPNPFEEQPVSIEITTPQILTTESKTTDNDFLDDIKQKLGKDNYDRLIKIIQNKDSEHTQEVKEEEQSHGPVKKIKTKSEWESTIQTAKGKIVIVDCSAVWCAPCHRIAPKFHAFAEKYGNSFVFLTVDIQENTYVKQLYQVDQLPAFLFLKEGKQFHRIIGDKAAELEEYISKLASEKVQSESSSSDALKTPQELNSSKTLHYDYVVIGGGSGGMASAKEAAKYGAKVALFDYVKPSTQNTQWGLGGTCVNVGCVPKKLMHYGALLGEALHADAKAYGWQISHPQHNWSKLVDTVQSHVKKLNFFYENGLKSANQKTLLSGETVDISKGSVTYYNALAHFTDSKSVSWKDDEGHSGIVTGTHILISVGGRPIIPRDIPGALEYSITSDDLFSHRKVPGKTLCVGAGYISLECGGFLTHFGYEVVICVRSVPLRVGGFDRQSVDKVISLMKAQGTKFLMHYEITKIEKLETGKLQVSFINVENKHTHNETFDTVLYATGRGADTQGLNISAAGVAVTNRGTVITDKNDRTNVPHIYAVGDVAEGRPELTPVAIQAGELLSRRLFANSHVLMNYDLVPTTVFTPFEYGRVGLSEDAAIAQYGADAIEVYLSEFSTLEIGAAHRPINGELEIKSPDAVEEDNEFPTNCLSKLICNKKDKDRIIGFHYVGPNAGEITQGFALSLKLGATKEDFDSVVGIHPTDAESFMALSVTKASKEVWEVVGGCGGGKCG